MHLRGSDGEVAAGAFENSAEGIDGSAQVTGYSGYILKFLQSGRVPNYAMAITLGVVGLAVLGLVVRA